MEINNIEIDWLAQEVILALSETPDGISNTSEIRKSVGLNGEHAGRRIKHRFDKLEEAGLAITDQPQPDERNIWPPKRIMLTKEGERVLDSDAYAISGNDDGETIYEQVERLETRLNRVETENVVLKELLGLATESSMPSVLQMRAAYTGLDQYLVNEAHVDVSDYAPDEVLEEVADLKDDLESVRD